MQRTSFAEMDCSIAQTLEIVGEWWTLLVIRDAFTGIRRFEGFQRSLSIARNVLTQRLERLVEHGIFERRLYQHGPDRYEYRLTEKGLDLYPILVACIGWGDRWATDSDGPPLTLIHKACGHEGSPALVCAECGDTVDARAMSTRWNQGRPHPRHTPGAGDDAHTSADTPTSGDTHTSGDAHAHDDMVLDGV